MTAKLILVENESGQRDQKGGSVERFEQRRQSMADTSKQFSDKARHIDQQSKSRVRLIGSLILGQYANAFNLVCKKPIDLFEAISRDAMKIPHTISIYALLGHI